MHLPRIRFFAFALLGLTACQGLLRPSGASAPPVTCLGPDEAVPLERMESREYAAACAPSTRRFEGYFSQTVRNTNGESWGEFDIASREASGSQFRFNFRDTALNGQFAELEPGTKIGIEGTYRRPETVGGGWSFLVSRMWRVEAPAADKKTLAAYEPTTAKLVERNASIAADFVEARKKNSVEAYADFIEKVQGVAAKETGIDKHPDWARFITEGTATYERLAKDSKAKLPKMAGAKSAVMSPMAKALIGMAESHLEKAPVNSFAFALKGPGDEPWGQPAIARAVPPQYPYVLEAIVRVARLRDPKGNFDTETAALVDDYELGDAKKKQQALHIIERWQLSSVASTMLRKFPKDAAVLRSLALLHGETPEDESALALSAERRWREAKCEDAEPKQSDMSWGDTTCDVIQAAPLQHPTATLIHAFASKPMRSRSSVVTLLALQAAGLEVDIKPVLKEFHAYWRRTHAHYGLRLIFRKDPAKGRELGLGAVSSKPIAGPMSTGPYVGSKPEQTWLDPPFGQSGPFIKYIAPVFDEFVTDRETYVKLFGAVLADSWSDREMFQWIRYVGPKLGATPAKRVGAPEYAAVVLAGIKNEKLSLEQRCGWLLVASYFDVGPDVDKYRTYLASGSNGRLGWFAQDPIKRTCESSPSGQSQTRD